MADVKWIKMATGLPSNKKLIQIRALPEGDTIALMWVFMMCLAGDVNENGLIYITPEVPYTDEMLAEEFRMDINTIRLGLKTFERFGMIEIVEDIICLSAWEKWQSVDKLSEIREQTRKRVAKHREKQKLLTSNATGNVTVTHCNATDIEEDIDIELEEELEEEKEKDTDKRKTTDYQQVVGMYNEICISLPSVRTISDSRKKAIKARLNKYSLAEIQQAFINAEESDFLKGNNSRNWSADFDWLMNDTNIAKVLEGKYKNRSNARATDDVQAYFDEWRNA